jgi:hypothetical protein
MLLDRTMEPWKKMYCNVLGVLFTMDVYLRSKTQHTTVQYNQQLSKHARIIHRRAIGLLAHQNSTSAFSPSLNCHLLSPTIDRLHDSRDSQETPSTGPSLTISQHELTFLQSGTLQTHVCIHLPQSLNTN